MDTVTDPYHFYRNLCSAESFDELACSLFLGVDFPKLTEEAHATCNDRLTEEELREALFHGEQQIPWGGQTLTNFYRHFWPYFSNKLLLVYNYARRRGINSLVFKKGD